MWQPLVACMIGLMFAIHHLGAALTSLSSDTPMGNGDTLVFEACASLVYLALTAWCFPCNWQTLRASPPDGLLAWVPFELLSRPVPRLHLLSGVGPLVSSALASGKSSGFVLGEETVSMIVGCVCFSVACYRLDIAVMAVTSGGNHSTEEVEAQRPEGQSLLLSWGGWMCQTALVLYVLFQLARPQLAASGAKVRRLSDQASAAAQAAVPQRIAAPASHLRLPAAPVAAAAAGDGLPAAAGLVGLLVACYRLGLALRELAGSGLETEAARSKCLVCVAALCLLMQHLYPARVPRKHELSTGVYQ